jgi:ureidoglycolate hydrolase
MGANIKYLVVVTEGGDAPEMDRLRGYVAIGKQGVCYKPGICHAPMSVIDLISIIAKYLAPGATVTEPM